MITIKFPEMKRFPLLNVFATLILLCRFSSLLSQSGQGWKADPATVEKLSKSQPDINYYEEKVPQYKLPEILINSEGSKIQSSGDWEQNRRQEVLELFRENIYGRIPSTPYTKSYRVVNEDKSAIGGAALARRRYGETVARINKGFPHWFCTNYRKWNNNEDAMPVDMHMLMSLIAPRAVYITSADQDLWADPRGSYLSLFSSMPVYRLYYQEMSLPEQMPPMNKPVISGKTAYHVSDGVHNLLLKDWNWFMDFSDKVLK
jgi:hypothetical protein